MPTLSGGHLTSTTLPLGTANDALNVVCRIKYEIAFLKHAGIDKLRKRQKILPMAGYFNLMRTARRTGSFTYCLRASLAASSSRLFVPGMLVL